MLRDLLPGLSQLLGRLRGLGGFKADRFSDQLLDQPFVFTPKHLQVFLEIGHLFQIGGRSSSQGSFGSFGRFAAWFSGWSVIDLEPEWLGSDLRLCPESLNVNLGQALMKIFKNDNLRLKGFSSILPGIPAPTRPVWIWSPRNSGQTWIGAWRRPALALECWTRPWRRPRRPRRTWSCQS